jgi:hypothetical protein
MADDATALAYHQVLTNLFRANVRTIVSLVAAVHRAAAEPQP